MGSFTRCGASPWGAHDAAAGTAGSVFGVVLAPLAAVSDDRLTSVCGDPPGFFCREVLNRTENRTLAEIADFMLGKPLTILAIVAGALILNRLVGRAVKRTLQSLHSGTVRERLGAVRRRTPSALLETEVTSLRAEQRITALTSVLRSLASFAIFAMAALLILGEAGLDLGPLLAGAGILGIALGFGSQALVRDFLSGLFILVEDQFGVGDIVDLDGQTTGTVEAVSLRTTRLRAVDGTVWHVPNGDISRVGNKSQHWSRALLDIDVAYDTDIDRAKEVIKRVAVELWHAREDILEEPEVWGVESLGPHSVVIRLVVKTRPSDQYPVSRELRQRLKEAFDAEGIEIPFQQQTVWNRDEELPKREKKSPRELDSGMSP
jgi:moderate conductance mechanosensitive channel